jgi:hypothetical protein
MAIEVPRGDGEVKGCSGPPMTLGNAAAAKGAADRLASRDCRHQVEPDPAELVERYGAETTVPDWHSRLVCGRRGSRRVDMVVTAVARPGGAEG